MVLNIKRRMPSKQIAFPDDIHPVMQRVLAARNIQSFHDLNYSLQGLLPYTGLKGIREATQLLADAIKQQKKILIVADFDTDGATSCALAIKGLQSMGATHVDYIVPNRFEFGYGLSPEIVEIAISRQPHLLVTVDNGISSIDGVSLARAHGVDVLITDHHLPAQQLPDANAIVNPNQQGDNFPSKMLAGVGVVFYILMALRAYLRQDYWFEKQNIQEPNLATYLDLVALGTIADIVPLDRNNRILVSQGLARIRCHRCCAGIKALLSVANRSLTRVVAEDMGFAVGPRLNAAGRLADMSLGIECLLSEDENQAHNMAIQLDELNNERRAIQEEMQQQALINIRQLELHETQELPLGLCLFNENWHQGVIGILAAKIKNKLHRPIIIFARDKDDFIKGSGRSVPGVHIRDVLNIIATKHPELIETFGGHAMAAGLSLREKNLVPFEQAFDREIRSQVGTNDLNGGLDSDGELAAGEISFKLANEIIAAGPWGQGFPEPQFDGNFDLVESKIVAGKHLKLRLRAGSGGKSIGAIAFNHSEPAWLEKPKKVRAVYRLGVNDFFGKQQLQLMVKGIEAIE